jgi:hypothetical protein
VATIFPRAAVSEIKGAPLQRGNMLRQFLAALLQPTNVCLTAAQLDIGLTCCCGTVAPVMPTVLAPLRVRNGTRRMLGSIASNAPKCRKLSRKAFANTAYSASGPAHVASVVVPAATAMRCCSTTSGRKL